MRYLAVILCALGASTLVGCSVEQDAQTTLEVGEGEQLVTLALSGMT